MPARHFEKLFAPGIKRGAKDIKVESLMDNPKADLNRLKKWLYQQRPEPDSKETGLKDARRQRQPKLS